MHYLLKRITNYLNRKIYLNNVFIFSIFIFISVLFGFYMFNFESLTLIDTIYYLITTATSVGYGDISPKQDMGKIFAVIYMILSIGTLSIIIGIIIEKLITIIENKRKGKLKMQTESNLIIIGYPNEDKLKKIVTEISNVNKEKIVIITNKIDIMPNWFSEFNLTFIKGHISNKDTLDRANISKAKTILILTEENNEQSDDSAITTALFVKNLKEKSSRLILELNNTDKLIDNLFNENIVTPISSPYVLAQEILNEGAIAFSNAVFQNKVEGTQFNVIYTGKQTTWKDIAFNLIMQGLIPEAYKCNISNQFEFLPQPEDIINNGCLIKYRGSKELKDFKL